MHSESHNGINFCLYVRKSSEPKDRQILSIESQINELQAYARHYGIHIVKVFKDAASALKRNNRPGFESMLDSIEKGEIDGILTWKPDRLARNMIEGGLLVDLLQRSVIKIILTPNRTYKPTDNILPLTIEMGMANQYSLDLSSNIKRGNRTKISKGGFCALAPMGYLNDRLNKTIVPDPERFKIVKRLFEMYLTGQYSLKAICVLSKSLGLKSRKGKKVLSPSSLHKIFTNPFYYGLVRQGGHESIGIHKPMIRKSQFEQIQSLLSIFTKKPECGYDFPYTCLFNCGACGRTITTEEKYRYNCPQCNAKQSAKNPKVCACGFKLNPKEIKKIRKYQYYHCSGARECRQESLRKEELESKLIKKLSEFEVNQDFVDWAKRWMDYLEDILDQSCQIEKENIETSKRKLESKIQRLTDMRIEGELDKSEFIKKKSEYNGQLMDLIEGIDSDHSHRIESLKSEYSFLESLTFHFDKSQNHRKDEIIRRLLSNPILHAGKVHTKAKKHYLYLPDFKRHHFGAIEPPKNLSTKGLKGDVKDCFQKWYTTFDDYRTPD